MSPRWRNRSTLTRSSEKSKVRGPRVVVSLSKAMTSSRGKVQGGIFLVEYFMGCNKYRISMYSLQYMIPTIVGCPDSRTPYWNTTCKMYNQFGGTIKQSNLVGLSAPLKSYIYSWWFALVGGCFTATSSRVDWTCHQGTHLEAETIAANQGREKDS